MKGGRRFINEQTISLELTSIRVLISSNNLSSIGKATISSSQIISMLLPYIEDI